MKKVQTPMIKVAAMLLLALGSFLGAAAQQGKVYGVVRDTKGEIVIGATVRLKHDGMPTSLGAISNTEGRYDIYNVDPGTYTIEISYDEQITEVPDPVSVSGNYVVLNLTQGEYKTDGIVIEDQRGNPIPIFTVDPIQPVGLTRGEIEDNPYRKPGDMLATKGEVYQADAGGALYIGGGRSSGTITYLDGTKMIGTDALPNAAIEQVMLLSGGVPSEYGDANGGIITITTRNPGMKGYFGTPRSIVNVRSNKEKKQKGNPDAFLPATFSENSYVVK